jgi:hypothetical protein
MFDITVESQGRQPAVPLQFTIYTVAVVAAAMAVFAVPEWTHVWQASGTAAFWMLAVLVLVGELLPIPVPRRDWIDKVTISTAFAFAMLLCYGPGPATLVYVVSLVIADVVGRIAPVKVAFNAAQYAARAGGRDRAGVAEHRQHCGDRGGRDCLLPGQPRPGRRRRRDAGPVAGSAVPA